MPFIEAINSKRHNLLWVVFLVLDETIWGWRPKTSATGGMPNITYEPRKPVDLGAMARNGVEGITGIMAFQDPVADLTSQRLKPHMQDDNVLHLPGGGTLPVHCAEVLRQAEGAHIERGGWVCGDTWFGSVASAVELMLRLGVYSSELVHACAIHGIV